MKLYDLSYLVFFLIFVKFQKGVLRVMSTAKLLVAVGFKLGDLTLGPQVVTQPF